MARTAASPKTIAELGEFGLIARIKGMLPVEPPGVVIGLGDDAAALRPTPGVLLLATCDIQVEGRHFRREHITAYELGRRSAAINLSDIAAMGGRPRYALVSLALPQETEVEWTDELYRGLKEEFEGSGAFVIGGNLSGSQQGAVIDITLLGEVEEGRLLRRSGAKPGNVVLVSGTLGDSALGRLALERGLDRTRPEVAKVVAAHLTPRARVGEGQAIAESGLGTAMIDVSDGLASDLRHICEQSGVGARLYAGRLPMSAEASSVAATLGTDALERALHGGEDYELVVTCRPQGAAALAKAVQERTGTVLTEIGVITKETGMRLVLPSGQERPLAPLGWDHYR